MTENECIKQERSAGVTVFDSMQTQFLQNIMIAKIKMIVKSLPVKPSRIELRGYFN